MVGVIASQTLGEQSTQLVLNTFHLAGVGSAAKVITAAMPRLNEIMSYNNMKNETMEIYLKEEYNKDIEKIGSSFQFTQLKDIILRTEILYEDKEDILDENEDNELIKIYNEFSNLFDMKDENECSSNWILKIIFDKYSLINNNITISYIQEVIRQKGNTSDIDCVFNDDNASEIILRINFKNQMEENSLDIIREIEKSLVNMKLKGVKNIKNSYKGNTASVVSYKLDGSFENKKDNVIYTVGTNLQEIFEDKYVDTNKTYSNNINEVYNILGVEAARELLIEELNSIFESKPNPRHIELIADLMTYRGKLT